MDMFSANPYAMFLRRLDQSSLDSYRIHIRTDVKLDQRVYNSPSADQVAAIWIEGNNANVTHELRNPTEATVFSYRANGVLPASVLPLIWAS
ncbi:hypothetical protein RHSIM_Rhsim01G0079700 [Rhododendron simsii]|uniref:Uncharacterized protein n=1 Tax=Rhododendron simsii TaxID=118357 RepID=A0A834HEB2_RHOSS|nr:hypothetical protein RHSIM_Rhsim01G0079700 [Rhododendron simsii]